MTNPNTVYRDQPMARGRKARRFLRLESSKTPLKEANGQQTRDPEGHDKPVLDTMDISQRESARSLFAPRYVQNSVQSLCYKLDLGSEMPERLPRIDYGSRSGSFEDMAQQTAQIFRGVQLDTDGTVLKENDRATRSNAGKAPRKAKRSRQAANIHQARNLVDASVNEENVSHELLV